VEKQRITDCVMTAETKLRRSPLTLRFWVHVKLFYRILSHILSNRHEAWRYVTWVDRVIRSSSAYRQRSDRNSHTAPL